MRVNSLCARWQSITQYNGNNEIQSDNVHYGNVSSCTVEKVFFVFYPHTYPHHFPSRPLFFRQEGILLVTGIQWASRKQRYTGRIAMLHYRCNYAAHLVPDSCTFLTPFFCEFYLCCTIGIPMLYYQYTYAEPLVPECFTLLVPFFQFVYKQYQGELRVHSSFYYSKTYP